jgi:hypothetical protein
MVLQNTLRVAGIQLRQTAGSRSKGKYALFELRAAPLFISFLFPSAFMLAHSSPSSLLPSVQLVLLARKIKP